MASQLLQRLANAGRALSGAPMPKASPFREAGVSGTSMFGGRVQTVERSSKVIGPERWTTYADLVTNTSIVAAGVRYFLNIMSYAKWSVESADDTPAAKEVAAFVEEVIHDMATPWGRVVRRASMYRFHGFGIQEWTAKRRTHDSRIGILDIEARPQHTIERWEVDERGTVTGVWQRNPQTGQELPLPRSKILYLVEDSLTDSPEGLGLFRHLVDSNERLKAYLTLEGKGFERDLRGIPVGRAPYAALKSAVESGAIQKEDALRITQAIEDFVRLQSKQSDTSIVLDSAPYVTDTTNGKAVSGIYQYGIDLLQGQSSAFAELDGAINRLNKDMARVLGVEHLLLGDGTGGNRALSEDKSRNFYLVCNSSLDEIGDGGDKDVVTRICDLNGIPDELRPWLKHSDVSFRSVQEITAALRDMATAGAVLAPNDPAVDDVRDMLGISKSEPISLDDGSGDGSGTGLDDPDPTAGESEIDPAAAAEDT